MISNKNIKNSTKQPKLKSHSVVKNIGMNLEPNLKGVFILQKRNLCFLIRKTNYIGGFPSLYLKVGVKLFVIEFTKEHA